MKHFAHIFVFVVLLGLSAIMSGTSLADDPSADPTQADTTPISVRNRLLQQVLAPFRNRVDPNLSLSDGKQKSGETGSGGGTANSIPEASLGTTATATTPAVRGSNTDVARTESPIRKDGNGTLPGTNVARTNSPIIRDGGGKPGAGRPPKKNKKTARWMPVCVFVADDVAPGLANNIIKGMVDKAANECDVKLEVEVRTATNLPKDDYKDDFDKMKKAAKYINDQQTKGCNAQALGVPRAATTTITNLTYIAAAMCDSKEPKPGTGGREKQLKASTAGCAKLAKNTGLTPGQLADENTTDGEGEQLEIAEGGVSPSILAKGGNDPDIAEHEVAGHSIMGMPNGNCLGYGIGFRNQDEIKRGGCTQVKRWNDEACAIMKRQTYPNDRNIEWDPDRKFYYNMQDPTRAWNMAKAPPVFDSVADFKKDPPVKAVASAGPNTKAGDTYSYDNAPKAVAAQSAPAPDATNTPSGSGHKIPPGGGGAGQNAGASPAAGDKVNVVSFRNKGNTVEGGSGAGDTKSYAYDASAAGGGIDISKGSAGGTDPGATGTGGNASGGDSGGTSDSSGGGQSSAASNTTPATRSPASDNTFGAQGFFNGVGKVPQDADPSQRGSTLRGPTEDTKNGIYYD